MEKKSVAPELIREVKLARRKFSGATTSIRNSREGGLPSSFRHFQRPICQNGKSWLGIILFNNN